jgi:hypothetical protein
MAAAPNTDAEDLGVLDRVLEDGGSDGATRRRLLSRAAAGVAAGGAMGLVGGVGVADARADSLKTIASTIATAEAFGTTFLFEAIRRSPGTPSAQFAPILRAAVTAEFDHIAGLARVGGKPVTKRFWIPEALFGAGGAGLFRSIETVENIEISSYLAAVTTAAKGQHSKSARILSAALGVESEHRALARQAQIMLNGTGGPSDNRSFEAFPIRTAATARRAIEKQGIGLGKQTSAPGRFYTFPGDPVKRGVGTRTSTRRAQ